LREVQSVLRGYKVIIPVMARGNVKVPGLAAQTG